MYAWYSVCCAHAFIALSLKLNYDSTRECYQDVDFVCLILPDHHLHECGTHDVECKKCSPADQLLPCCL
jgi:hypothetical protein